VPSGPTCPTGAACAQPVVTPHTSGGASGSNGASGGSVATPGTGTVPPVSPVSPPNQPAGSGTTGSGTTTSDPPVGTTGCTPLVVELSTDKAVGTGSVSLPGAPPSSGTVEILGTGSFGTAEGAPVGWAAVWVGDGVASVQLSVGGAAVDTMAPDGGIVVLTASGNPGLDGASVAGLDQSGATVDSVAVGQATSPDTAGGCPAPISTPPTTPAPTTTTTTTTTTTPGGASTTTTTVTGAPVPVPTGRPATPTASGQPNG
jgi:collagen type I/II/III/V/XI/XXIV/XXVII alpha